MPLRPLMAALAAALLLLLPAGALADPGRVVSAVGEKTVRGQKIYVDVLVAVPPGQSSGQATEAALQEQGAKARKRPPGGGGGGSPGFAFNGLRWDSGSLTQHYNDDAEPIPAGGALQSTQSKWSNVSQSAFDIFSGSPTDRCPSLVRECPSAQSFDSNNDVAWLNLGRRTLGVTWYGTSIDEADMALNTRFPWHSTCGSLAGSYDVESVMLHENGHVAGLDHVNDQNQVMYPSYTGASCTLGSGDQAGIRALYPG